MFRQNSDTLLMRSRHLHYFAQHGTIYAYHNLFGYIIAMSPDLVDLLEFHRTLRTVDEVTERFGDQWNEEQRDEFLGVLQLFACLVDSELAEERSAYSMVAVRSRWVVFHAESPTQVTVWSTARDGKSVGDTLSPWASVLFLRVDGETTVEALIAELLENSEVGPALAKESNPRESVRKELARWTHSDHQYCKLAKAPLSKFGKEHQWPSYLRSTMPYAPYLPGKDPVPVDPLDPVGVPLNPPHAYYEGEIHDAEAQFADVETTLSHLFRVPHPLLQGATYAERVTDALMLRGSIGPSTKRIVEVGGGLGHVAAGILARLKDRAPEVYAGLDYTILDLSPTLRTAQQQLLTERGVAERVQWIAANAETHVFEPGSVDLLMCNEVIGDFTTIKLTAALAGLESDGETEAARAARQEKLGDTTRILAALTLRDAPDPFFLNLGAFKFVESLWTALSADGTAFITEFGEIQKYPVPSTQLDHLEFSIHFGQLHQWARHLGFDARIAYVQDIIGLDRDARTLATTRTYFASLRAMLLSFGVTLDKIAYTEAMLRELLGDKVQLEAIGDLRFEPVDERCMGLAPHEFKALILQRTGPRPDVVSYDGSVS